MDGPPRRAVIPQGTSPAPREVFGQAFKRTGAVPPRLRPAVQAPNLALRPASLPPSPATKASRTPPRAPPRVVPPSLGPHLRPREPRAVAEPPGRDGGPGSLIGAIRAPIIARSVPTRLAPKPTTASRSCRGSPPAGYQDSESRYAPATRAASTRTGRRARRLVETHTQPTLVESCPGSLGPSCATAYVGRLLATPELGPAALLGERQRSTAKLPRPSVQPEPSLKGGVLPARTRGLAPQVFSLRASPDGLRPWGLPRLGQGRSAWP